MNAVVQSIGGLFSSGGFPATSEPDNALHQYGKPAPDFVLCRDEAGNATAVYGDEVWDFNPYRLSAKKVGRIKFDTVFGEGGLEQQVLIDEAKYLLYCLIYFAGGGRVGTLSVTTLGQHWLVLRIAMQFCLEQRQKPMVGTLSLQKLFTVPVYLAAFIREKTFAHRVLSGILQALARVGEERLGYPVVNPNNFDLKREDGNQHPVIPTRIYLNFINITGNLLDQLFEGVGRFEGFIACFANEYYGTAHSYQKSRSLGGKANWRPNMAQALKDHSLTSVFSGDFACPHKRNLQAVLLKMQYVAKTVIHLYTGMRDQEVMRIPYNCLSAQIVRKAVVDDQGVKRDRPQTVSVLSTTTKFTGYKKEGAWFAPGEVVKAVEVAQAICRGLAKLYQIELDERCPLFLNPAIVGYTRNSAEVGVPAFKGRALETSALRAILIHPEDLQELAHSDPSRDFYNEPEFAVGQPWPLTSHQFRRSLAFYGSSSGFVSLPSLRTQYKHMTIEMSRYYANHYENLRTIFGYYDEKKKDFVLPTTHFAFEYQMAMPMSVANQLIADLLLSEEPLFGGTGSYMEKQKERVKAGEIQIEDVRADTEQRVKSGAISYRPTLLGGCTKVGRCDSFLLGDYTECLSCEGAIIKPLKLNAAIEDATNELSQYVEGSGEYQIVAGDIERLVAFKARLINTLEF
ncbi:TPA: integrase [Pseudomonas aeruginosa]|nr:integrase [Pseudomonas aeruginosa]HCF9077924.1 integrase [Pseudomonas aeruginosa]HCF9084401.1 integrase [Pseudomonas aeruginosa]HCF9091058.1 integrase [Pseudomonas aeruginosa]HCF9097721.1 integrase [Pseudomonas aeruginosa]